MWTTAAQPVLIAGMVVLEVAVWQVRVALATRGRKRVAAVLGAVNAVLSVVALGQVVTNLDRPANVAGYAVGVALGVYLGVVADGRFAGEPVEHRVVVSGNGVEPAGELRAMGWPVTTQPAIGLGGAATVLSVVVDPRRTAEIEHDLARVAPDGFHTSIRLRSANRMPLSSGLVGVAEGARLIRSIRDASDDTVPATP